MVFLNDVVRAELVSKADAWGWRLVWSTIALLVGIIMEEWRPLDRLYTHNVNTRTKARIPRVWVIRSQLWYAKLAFILVFGAIAAEGICEFFGAKAESAVRNFDNQTAIKAGSAAHSAADDAAQAKTDAGSAHTLAQSASDISGKAKTEAGEAENEVQSVTSRAELLQQQLDFRGPRAELFEGTDVTRPGLGKFMAAIKPFKRQKVEIISDLTQIRDEDARQETEVLVSTLKFLLGQVSGWNVSRGQGGHNWGVEVVFSRKAPSETREAARALASGLGDVGLTGMQRQKPEAVEAQAGSEIDQTNLNPDTVLLFVGQHP